MQILMKWHQSYSSASLTRNEVPLLTAYLATSWWQRLTGLFASPGIDDGHALMIEPCNSVHTVGLAYCIDVAFLNRDGTIMKLVSMKPCSVALSRGAHRVLEMREGTAAQLGLRVGQQLQTRIHTKGGCME